MQTVPITDPLQLKCATGAACTSTCACPAATNACSGGVCKASNSQSQCGMLAARGVHYLWHSQRTGLSYRLHAEAGHTGHTLKRPPCPMQLLCPAAGTCDDSCVCPSATSVCDGGKCKVSSEAHQPEHL